MNKLTLYKAFLIRKKKKKKVIFSFDAVFWQFEMPFEDST